MHRLQELRSETGQALTEFAVVLPLLFIVIFAIVEGGMTMNNYLQLTDAVRVAARAASLNGAQGQVAAKAAATTALTGSADDLTFTKVDVTQPDNDWTSGKPVTVTASVHYAVKLPLVGTVLSGDLTSQSIQRIE